MAINYDINIIAKDNASRVLSRVEQNLNKIGSSPGATNAATGLTSITRIAGPAALAVTAVATAMTAVSKSAIDATKQFENYRNRLSLVTNSSTELASTMTRLQGLAVQNRTSFADTVDLYSKLGRSTFQTSICDYTETKKDIKLKEIFIFDLDCISIHNNNNNNNNNNRYKNILKNLLLIFYLLFFVHFLYFLANYQLIF